MTDNEKKELARLLAACAAEPIEKITSPLDIVPRLNRYATGKVESFGVITMNGSLSVIKIRIITRGLLNRTLARPREVFIPALRDNAACIFIFHNHPSGSVEPSEEDNALTKKMKEAGEIIGIPLIDHLIIAKSGAYYSFKENDKL